MALYYELQVFKDVYTLVQKVFLYTQAFPREYKYTLGQDMKRDAIQLVRSIYRANKAKDKVVYLETFAPGGRIMFTPLDLRNLL